jgi:group I intron endonuclease
MYLVYIAKSPSNKMYVGITNNFKRRLKEHGTSPYPFGKALRKYGKENFSFSFIECKTLDEAYEIEELLIDTEEVKGSKFYNISCGGRPDIQLGKNNPMHRPEILAKHPSLFTTENNPMNNPNIKKGHNSHQKKPVSVSGIKHSGVRDAAKALGFSRQKLVHRLKSESPLWDDHFYL